MRFPCPSPDDGRTTTIPTNVLARDSVVAHTRHRGYHHGITRANEKDIPDFLELSPISSNYFALLRTSIADTTPDGSRPQPPAFLERHAALPEKPEAEEYLADSNLEVRKTLQQDQLSTWCVSEPRKTPRIHRSAECHKHAGFGFASRATAACHVVENG